eukprot:m.181189 g.181189  ORF g.181189 m.181189 type:complete len:947 (+) comp15186_c0_seq1:44-2884(+)
MAGAEVPLRAVPPGPTGGGKAPQATSDGFPQPDDLLAGVLNGPDREKAELLKAAYTKLLVAARESTSRQDGLESQAADLEAKLAETKATMAGLEEDDDEDDAFVVQLDRAWEELEEVKRRRTELEANVLELEGEREGLADKLEAIENTEPSEEEEDIRKVKEAMAQCTIELAQRKEEAVDLKAQVSALTEARAEAERARDEAFALRTRQKSALTREEGSTQRMVSTTEHQVEPVIDTLRSELAAAHGRLERLDGDLASTRSTLEAAEAEEADMEKKLAQISRTHSFRLAQETQLKNDLVRLQQNEISLQAERVELMSKIKLAKGDARALLAAMSMKEREKEKGLIQLKQTDVAIERIQVKVDVLNNSNAELDTQIKVCKRKIKEMGAQIETVAAEKHRMEQRVMTSKALKESELKSFKTIVQKKQEAEKALAAARKEVYELERARRKAERMMDQADAEATKAHEDARQANLDFIDVKGAMTDARDRLGRLEAAETDMKNLYQAIKNEKNKFASQTTALAQRLTDMNDKFKMLANEQEILRASALERMVGISLLESKIMEEHRIREKILTEESEARSRNKNLRDLKRTYNADAKLLFDRIDASELALADLSSRRVKMHQEKNDLASRYALKMEELQVVYNKLEFISMTIRKGDVQLTQRESDLRFFSLEAGNLKRAIELLKSRQPIKEGIERELIKTRLELFKFQKLTAKKEKLLEQSGDNVEGRTVREVQAWDIPSDDKLQEKLVSLSNRLAQQEARELELDLILQETNRLQGRIEKQVDNRKGNSAVNQRAVTEAQTKLADLTRKTMAIVSELTMYQGTCIRQQQNVHEIRQQLEEGKARVERGDPPTEDAQKEWDREKRRAEQAALRKEMESLGISPGTTVGQGTALADGTITYAEQRPAAYIPQAFGVMPKSKPFGSSAPFKQPPPSKNLKFYTHSQATTATK